MATPFTVTELLALIDRAGAFIGNDSGPGHLAAFCGVPTFTIFGPHLPDWFAPLHPAAEWIEGKVCPYIPCSDYCRFPEPHCLWNIGEEEVWSRVVPFLAGHFTPAATVIFPELGEPGFRKRCRPKAPLPPSGGAVHFNRFAVKPPHGFVELAHREILFHMFARLHGHRGQQPAVTVDFFQKAGHGGDGFIRGCGRRRVTGFRRDLGGGAADVEADHRPARRHRFEAHVAETLVQRRMQEYVRLAELLQHVLGRCGMMPRNLTRDAMPVCAAVFSSSLRNGPSLMSHSSASGSDAANRAKARMAR